MYTQKELTKELKKLKKDEIIEICLKVTRSKEILHIYIEEYKSLKSNNEIEKLIKLSNSLGVELDELALKIKNASDNQEYTNLITKYAEKNNAYIDVNKRLCHITL